MNRIEGFKTTKRAQLVARMNQRYHLGLSGWFGRADKAVRILVGVAAVTSAIVAVALNRSALGTGLAIVSAAMAVILNILLFGDWEKKHRDLFHSWSDLRNRWESLELKAVKGGV